MQPQSDLKSCPAAKPRVSVVITDLDNTLFDWVAIWYASFRAMLDRLVLDSSVPLETLEREFREVHQRHRTSEYAFAIEELPSLQKKHPGEDLAKKYNAAIYAHNSARKGALCLYPGVLETLELLKDKGCLLVGYTESMAYYSNYRVRHLGLDRILDFLYSPPDHELPDGLSTSELRMYPPSHYTLRRTVARHTPEGKLKPSAEILRDIITSVGALPEETIYIGDSLMKDVAMAKDAGAIDVWAKYGVAQERPEYQLLRRVTHWTAADVEREKRLTRTEVPPTYVLEESIAQLPEFFEFVRFFPYSEERMGHVMDAWKTSVDVQQHFNDLELRIRNYGITLLVAVLGATAFALKENLIFVAFGANVPLGSALLIAGMIGWLAFYGMDRLWYHRLLYGAVKHGLFIEGRLKRDLPEICLTEAIGKSSPIKIAKWTMHSTRKIDLFYIPIFIMLLTMTIAVWRSGTLRTDAKPAPVPHQSDSGVITKPPSAGAASEEAPTKPTGAVSPQEPETKKPVPPVPSKGTGPNPKDGR